MYQVEGGVGGEIRSSHPHQSTRLHSQFVSNQFIKETELVKICKLEDVYGGPLTP